MLAFHFVQGHDPSRALPYLIQASRMALHRLAYHETIGHCTGGLELLATLPDSPERIQQELDLRVLLGPALIATQGYTAPEVEATYSRARDLCQQVGETPQLFSVLCGLARFFIVRADYHTAQGLGDQMLDLALHLDDLDCRLAACIMLGITYFYLGELTEAQKYFDQGLALYDPDQHHEHTLVYGQDLGVLCRLYLAWTLWVSGYVDQARMRLREGLNLARERSHAFTLTRALLWAAFLEQLGRNSQGVLDYVDEAFTLANERGFHLEVLGIALQGWALCARGQREAGMAQFRTGFASYRATGSGSLLAYFLALMAEQVGQAGQTAAALDILADAHTIAAKTGECVFNAELHRLRAELLAAHDVAPEDVRLSLQEALDVARGYQAKSLELRAASSLARLWQRQGQRDEARELLTEVYGWFMEGLETPDLQEAKALLDTLAK